jgi:hypothetical protein
MAKRNQVKEKEEIFRRLNAQLVRLDETVGNNIRCPLCWQLFKLTDIESTLSIEHVPPSATTRLIKEISFKTLTCKRCNHTYGSKYHSQLKNFLIFQLHQNGKYDKPIKGKLRNIPDNDLASLNSNIVLTPKQILINIAPTPGANAPSWVQDNISKWNKIVEEGITDWSFQTTLDYECSLSVVWPAYLQVAYLMMYILSDCWYAFTPAGIKIRESLIKGDINEVGPCVINPNVIGVGGKPWIARISEPAELRCFWVKLAGNIVILPLPEDDQFSCFKAWQQVSSRTNFGLSPNKPHLRLNFHSMEHALEAQKCVNFNTLA